MSDGFTQHELEVLRECIPIIADIDRHGDGNRDPYLESIAAKIAALLPRQGMSDDEPTAAPTNDSPEALRAAMEKENTVTSWVSLDVEKLRTQPPFVVVQAVIAAGEMIRDNLVSELGKNGIWADPHLLRKARRVAGRRA